MSFYSGLSFYRPGHAPTPPVTTDDLARFVERFGALGLHDPTVPAQVAATWSPFSAKIALGRGMDTDVEASNWLEPTEAPHIYTTESIDWDTRIQARTPAELAEKLRPFSGVVYRAHISLHHMPRDMAEEFSWRHVDPKHPGSNNTFFPHGWSFSVEPVLYEHEDEEVAYFLGWMQVRCSGSGYFFPWKPKDCIDRLQNHPSIAQLMELCRELFPVPPRAPVDVERRARTVMSKTTAWPYPSVDRPLDWCWGASGCGA